MNAKLIDHGMEWNGHKITCLCSDERKGWVVLGIETKRKFLQVYVTKTGKIRVHERGGKEWKP